MSWGTLLPRSETRPNRDPSPDDSLGARTERPSCGAPPTVGLADAVLHNQHAESPHDGNMNLGKSTMLVRILSPAPVGFRG